MKLVLVGAAAPLVASAMVIFVVGGAGANSSPQSGACGGGGTALTVGSVDLDAEQISHAHTIVTVTAKRRLPPLAAVIAEATAYTESKLRNSDEQTDHDSEGLFQQRVSIYTEAVAIDPVRATNAFLDGLVKIEGWQSKSIGENAQSVQVSAYPGRYEPNVTLAKQLVGQFWFTAAAGIGRLGSVSAVCAGGGGAIPGGAGGTIVGPRGNNVAGTTSVPRGFIVSGTAKGRRAVAFALRQLGKPYVWGAAGPNAFDCSGITMAAWASAGVALPHQAAQQVHEGTPTPINLREAVGGDLVFIPGSDGTAARPGHVGMIAGWVDKSDGRHLWLIQAPMTGVPVELTEATRWSGQVTDVRHIA